MTYADCLEYLFSQLPMYQRVGKAAYKADLKNTIALCELLDHPERAFKSIHIAGTNGKGSVSHMMASVLQESGMRTGLYTSPHLVDFRERIRVNGKTIPQDIVVSFVERYKKEVEKIEPSFFEWTMAMAFDYFRKEKVDMAVIETGMGGRLDSTNVIIPEVSVITNIGDDHKQFLGDTRAAIAGEKAGIIKKNRPVVIGEDDDEVLPVFEKKAGEMSSALYRVSAVQDKSYEMDLLGPYQAMNRKTVLCAIDVLRAGGYHISEEAVKAGLSEVKRNTGFRGRWEWISNAPPVLIDTGHNADGIRITMEALEKMSYQRLFIVWGMIGDKDISGILKLLPRHAYYFFCKPNIPRGLDEKELRKQAGVVGLKGVAYGSVREALEAAKKMALNEDLVFVGGSTFVVAEVVEA